MINVCNEDKRNQILSSTLVLDFLLEINQPNGFINKLCYKLRKFLTEL